MADKPRFVTRAALVRAAQEAAAEAKTWADLSNFLFGPHGLIMRHYPHRERREAFTRTEEYQQIQKILQDKIEETGVVDGATPRIPPREP